MKKDKYHPLYSGGSFIIGQEQDGQPFGGLFDKNQAFSGKITQTELWNVNLSSDEISDIANCLKPTVKSKNRVVTWGSRAWDIFNVNMKEVPIETFCQTNILSNLLIYPEGVSNDVFKVFCDVVDGQFPIITENSQDKGMIFFQKNIYFLLILNLPKIEVFFLKYNFTSSQSYMRNT